MKIIDSTKKWPYPEASGRKDWTEISEVDFYEMMHSVPPLHMEGNWFIVGEPAFHNDDDIPIHALCVTINDRYYMLEVPFNLVKKAIESLVIALSQEVSS